MGALGLALWVWQAGFYQGGVVVRKFTALVVLIIFRLNVYPLLLAGWASRRKYALVGSLRGVAQTISYEVSLALILIRVLL